jgi:hypothetical protein
VLLQSGVDRVMMVTVVVTVTVTVLTGSRRDAPDVF